MKGVIMKPIVEFRCLMNTKFKPNIQNGIARCDKTLNEYVTKNGNKIREVLCDYGNGICTKSEVFENKIVNTLTDGSTIVYHRNHLGDVLIQEGSTATLSKKPNLWKDLISNIFKGF